MVDLRGRNVLVAGAGVTGRSTVAALQELGANVTVTITDGRPEALAEFGSLAAPGLAAPPPGTDLVVTSPGFKPSNPLLVAAASAGIEVIGEVELAWRLSRDQVWLAVTGTDGKTTTVGMLESILVASGAKAVACGNVGLPVIDAVRAGYDVLAVELSSYQLHWQDSLQADAAVVLNLAEDHLEWHGSMDEYVAAKAKIYQGAKTRIFNADDEWSVRLAGTGIGFTTAEPGQNRYGVRDGWLVETTPAQPAPVQPSPAQLLHDTPPPDQPPPLPGGAPGPVYRGQRGDGGVAGDLWTTQGAVDNSGQPAPEAGAQVRVPPGAQDSGHELRLCPVDEIHPPGLHNVSNALAASALARAYGVTPGAIREGLRNYQPQPHRVQLIAERNGVKYVNDSKATNNHAAAGSLTAYDNIVWIAGGLLHGAQVDDLVVAVAGRLRAVVLLGADQEVFAQAIRRHAPEVPVQRVDSRDDEPMTAAVRAARDLARPGDVVLLAPAAKSHDQFTSYVHRGEAFIDAVEALGS